MVPLSVAMLFEIPGWTCWPRRLRRFQANTSGLVGTLHRLLATEQSSEWLKPSPALAGALTSIKWCVRRNPHAVGTSWWPLLDPEPSYRGRIHFTPQTDPAPRGTTRLRATPECLCCSVSTEDDAHVVWIFPCLCILSGVRRVASLVGLCCPHRGCRIIFRSWRCPIFTA